MERVYLDTAPVIFLIEEVPPWVDRVRTRLGKSGVILVSSHLTRMECCVYPIRHNNPGLVREFEVFFTSTVSEMAELSSTVMGRAAEIRALYGFQTPDSIHLAAAVVQGCDVFLTNDHRLDRFTGITVETLQP